MTEYMRGAALALCLVAVILVFAHQAYHRGRLDGQIEEVKRRMEDRDA